jgi:predicted type IV restriction endonuclease
MWMRLPYFEISPDAYLYPEKVKESVRKQPEEPVRQWCAYELVRAYGISVANIEFERPVRMGSRPHWIDILVLRDGKPSVVVECKKPSDRKAEKAMEQAVSYADAPDIRAEFAVVTNGTDWQVKRRIQGIWCPVPDLPREIDFHSATPQLKAV